MKILCNGAFSINSAGDDASLESISSLLRNRLGDDNLEVKVLSRHPNASFDNAFGVRTIQNLEYSSKEASLNRWLRGFNYGDPPELLLDMLKEYEWADLVILGAGNFINENSFGLFRGMLSRFCISAFFAKLSRTPCMLYGLSATKLNSPLAIRMAQWLFDNVSMVTFREEISLKLLQDSGIKMPDYTEVLPDPVLAASCAPLKRTNEIMGQEGIPIDKAGPRLAVSLRELYHRSAEIHEGFMDRIRQVVDNWTANGGEILVIPQCTYEFAQPYADDRHLAKTLLTLVKNPGKVYAINSHYWPWEVESLYSVCDLALCTRLHAGVYACKQSVPAVALSYEPKVQGFWEQIGLSEYCLPMETSAEKIIKQLAKAHSDFPKNAVKERIALLKKKTERYADIAMELSRAKVLH